MGTTTILYALGMLALTVGVKAFEQRSFRKDQDRWQKIAAAMGLTLTSDGAMGPCLTGRLRGFSVNIGTVYSGSRNIGITKPMRVLRIYVDGIRKFDPALILRAKGRLASLTRLVDDNNVCTQDAAFDAAVHIEGDEQRILAVMSHPARQAVLELLKLGETTVTDSKIVMESDASWEDADIRGLTSLVVSLAERLALPVSAMAHKLAANALTDPIPEVRKRNLECFFTASALSDSLLAALVHSHPLKEATADSAQAALTAADPRLRLIGGMLVGEEAGFAALTGLVEQDSVPAEVRAQAMAALAAQFARERVEPILATALLAASAPLVTAAVQSVGAARAVGLTGSVCALAETASAPLQIEIAKALGALASPDAEPTLLRLLGSNEDEVRIAAAQALGQAGTVRAVEPLLLVKNGLLRDVKTAARQAARAIQGRLGNAEAGRLSVVEQEDNKGALSLTSEGGELSLANPPTAEPKK